MEKNRRQSSMTYESGAGQGAMVPSRQLHRVLGTLDLVLLNVAAIVGLRWLSLAAQLGPSSLALWVLGAITFLVPAAFTVQELSSLLPGEGGLYLWSKAAFGDLHGFVAGWSYWISNLVFFPSLLLFTAGVFPYIPGGSWLALTDNSLYNGATAGAILWFATLLNVVGLERAKWLQNVGAVATWCVGAMILVAALIAWQRFGTATPFVGGSWLPDLRRSATLNSFATIAFAYAGLELGLILGDEIKDPKRTVPRALLMACVLIALIYIAGTGSLLVALPASQINAISGIPQALAAIAGRVGVPMLGYVAATLLALSAMGGLGAWITGTARLPFLFGIDRYLPKSIGAVHPRFGSPYVALVTQAMLATIVLLAAVSGSAIREAYAALIDMTVILGLLPLLYMFAALPVLRRRATADALGMSLIPGGARGGALVALSGFSVTMMAVIFAMVPPADSPHPRLFQVKVVGGSVALLAVGLICFVRGRTLAATGTN
jgi:amino acid transporter